MKKRLSILATSVSLILLVSSPVFSQNEATFFFSPLEKTVRANSVSSVELRINSPKAITSFQAYLNFDPKTVSIKSIETESGLFPYWWENGYNNNTGKIQLQASTPLPGFKGASEPIAKIKFKGLNVGETTLDFDSSSLVLQSNDKNILDLANSKGAILKIIPPQSISLITITVPSLGYPIISAFILSLLFVAALFYFSKKKSKQISK